MRALPSRDQRFRDPVHGYVTIPREIYLIASSPQVQRLRNISQNSRAIAAYPGLNGSRYEHALGTMELSVRAWRSAWENIWLTQNGKSQSPRTTIRVRQELFRQDVERSIHQARNKGRADGFEAMPPDPFLDAIYPPGGFQSDYQNSERDWIERFPRILENALAVVALLHDIGHPPFSHVLEPVYEDFADQILGHGAAEEYARYKKDTGGGGSVQFHEWAGKKIVWQILNDKETCSQISTTLVWIIYRTRKGSNWAHAIHSLIDGEIDVDRLDYICRDARRAGVDYYTIDVDRLITSLELHQVHRRVKGARKNGWEIGVGQRGISAVESLLIQRDQSYRWMIFHSRALLADTALVQAFRLGVSAAVDSGGSVEWLNYVTKWGADGYPSYSVDDHMVLGWLRDSLQVEPLVGDMGETRRRSLARIWDQFHDTPVATWRHYGEFLDAIKPEKIRAPLDDLIRAWEKRESEDRVLIEMRGTTVRRIATDAPNGFEFGESLGHARKAEILLRGLRDEWQGRRGRLGHPNIDEELQQRLDADASEVGGIKGSWLVAHRLKFSAIKVSEGQESTERLRLWSGVDQEEFRHLSPIWDGLDRSNSRRPMIWGWFCPEDESLPPGRTAVQEAFMNVLLAHLKSLQPEVEIAVNNHAEVQRGSI